MKEMFSYGIRYVIDLYNVEAERMYTWNEMTARGIPKVLFLQWYGIISSLPSAWKKVDIIYVDKESVEIQFQQKIGD